MSDADRTRQEVEVARAIAARMQKRLAAEDVDGFDDDDDAVHRILRFAAYLIARDRIGHAIELIWQEPPFPEEGDEDAGRLHRARQP